VANICTKRRASVVIERSLVPPRMFCFLLIFILCGCNNHATQQYSKFRIEHDQCARAFESISYNVTEVFERKRNDGTQTYSMQKIECAVSVDGAYYGRFSNEHDSSQLNSKPETIWLSNSQYASLISLQDNGHYELKSVTPVDVSDLEFKYYMHHLNFFPPIDEIVRSGKGQVVEFSRNNKHDGRESVIVRMEREGPTGSLIKGKYILDSESGVCLEYRLDFSDRQIEPSFHLHEITYDFNTNNPYPTPVRCKLEIHTSKGVTTKTHTYQEFSFGLNSNPSIYRLPYYDLPEPVFSRPAWVFAVSSILIVFGAILLAFRWLISKKRFNSNLTSFKSSR
jgi:hypothetical protein